MKTSIKKAKPLNRKLVFYYDLIIINIILILD